MWDSSGSANDNPYDGGGDANQDDNTNSPRGQSREGRQLARQQKIAIRYIEKANKNNNRSKNAKTGVGRTFFASRANMMMGFALGHLNNCLEIAGASVQNLGDLLNISDLGDILSDPDNREYYDDMTQSWMNDFNNFDDLVESVYNHLKDTKVYTLTPRAGAILNFALSLVDKNLSLPQGMMMGIGNTIYNNTGVLDPNNLSIENAALLGHESIHGIQSVAAGGISKYLELYMNEIKNKGYYKNKFEIAAYNFGPTNVRAERYTLRGKENKPPILLSQGREWWK